jgi:GTPase SAR1 family protein
MGNFLSSLWERMVSPKEMRIVMVGLDAAGKVYKSQFF